MPKPMPAFSWNEPIASKGQQPVDNISSLSKSELRARLRAVTVAKREALSALRQAENAIEAAQLKLELLD